MVAREKQHKGPALHSTLWGLRWSHCARVCSNKDRFARCQAAFPEADVQGLKEAAQLHTREAAIDALRHTRGDAQQAFLNELDALALNQDLVDALVREFASFR